MYKTGLNKSISRVSNLLTKPYCFGCWLAALFSALMHKLKINWTLNYCEQSFIFLSSQSKLRAHARSEGIAPTKEGRSIYFPKFTFSLATCCSRERRPTACGLPLGKKKHSKLTTWSLRDSLKTIPSASEVYNTPFPVSEMRQKWYGWTILHRPLQNFNILNIQDLAGQILKIQLLKC